MPITNFKKPQKVFSKVFTENNDSQWVYQSARGIQLAPGIAGYMTNIRPGGAVTVDLAVGNDLIAVEDLDNFSDPQYFRVSRSENYIDPKDNKEYILGKA